MPLGHDQGMRTLLLTAVFFGVACLGLPAADLPTVTVEHLYYLQGRGDRIKKLTWEEMVEYCLAQKIGGAVFDDLYQQLFNLRLEMRKMIKIDGIDEEDPRVLKLKRTHLELSELLRMEVKKVQNGVVREGQIATDVMETIARAQAVQGSQVAR